MVLSYRETSGKVRLLLADEVTVGKTLSLAASAMLSALLDDGSVLILCPSTLTFQWQVEMKAALAFPVPFGHRTKRSGSTRTATRLRPVVRELWGLMRPLNSGADFCAGPGKSEPLAGLAASPAGGEGGREARRGA